MGVQSPPVSVGAVGSPRVGRLMLRLLVSATRPFFSRAV